MQYAAVLKNEKMHKIKTILKKMDSLKVKKNYIIKELSLETEKFLIIVNL